MDYSGALAVTGSTFLSATTYSGTLTESSRVETEAPVQFTHTGSASGATNVVLPVNTVITNSGGTLFNPTDIFVERRETPTLPFTGSTILSVVKFGLTNQSLRFTRPIRIKTFVN